MDDSTAATKGQHLQQQWWDELYTPKPKYANFPNGEEIYHIVKENYLGLLSDANVNIITRGERHLGVVLALRVLFRKSLHRSKAPSGVMK